MITAEKTKVYTAKNDRVFKSIAHGNNGKVILEAILGNVFDEPVEILEFIPVELPQDTEDERKKVLDVLVRVGNRIINVEVNAQGLSEVTKIRNLAYLCKLFSKNVSKGQEIDVETEFLQINFIYNSIVTDKMVLKSYLTHEDGIYTKNFSIWNVFIENVEKICYTDAKEREKLRYLLMMDKTPEELANFFPDDEIIKMFRGEIVRLNSNAKFIREISEEEEKEMIHNTELKLSKQEGKEEGFVEGKAEGKAEGIAEGKKEEKIDVIKNLLSVNSPIETIAIAVDLNIDEVKNIIEEHNLDKPGE
mgnify:FL=1